ncbi:MAG: glycosyltransferase, partial [Halobacteriaceae archaeon]
ADAVVLPYRKSSQSGIFNWCAAHEVPVAGSRCAYFRSLADQYDCIELFNVADEDEAAQTIEQILYDEDCRDRLREGLRTFKERESFEHVTKRHIQLYTTSTHQ